MRCLTDRELAFVSGGNLGDGLKIIDGIVSGIIDGPVNAMLNIIPNAISGVVKLTAQTLTGMTQLFVSAIGLFSW